jgi:aminotransferase
MSTKVRGVTSQIVNKITPSGIRRFFDLVASTEGAISLGVGEPDFATPWHIREAAIYSLEKGYTMYTSNLGILELRQELARHLKKSQGLDYDPASELLITVGVSEGLDLACRAILDPGDEVIMPDPHYVAYDSCVVLAGGKPIFVPTNGKSNFELSAADVEAQLSDNTKAIMFGYPANPTRFTGGWSTAWSIPASPPCPT